MIHRPYFNDLQGLLLTVLDAGRINKKTYFVLKDKLEYLQYRDRLM
jgi:hypothetical protein